MQHQSNRGFSLTCLLLVLVGWSVPASAQLTSVTSYRYELFTTADRAALGQTMLSQSTRGAMALVFPDGRKPITDPKAIERWVVGGKPLRAVSYPGLNADFLANWGLAKEVAVSNAVDDLKVAGMLRRGTKVNAPQKRFDALKAASSRARQAKVEAAMKPVLAVNTGWTDLGTALGHFVELGGVRSAVDSGRAQKVGPSAKVARLLERRFDNQRGKGPRVALVGYSAGGYHTANTAWLLANGSGDKLSRVAVYNVGIATNLPPGVRAAQHVGSADFVGKSNSNSAALAHSSTKIIDGMSHLHGEHWRVGDASAKRPLEIQSLRESLASPYATSASKPLARAARRDPAKRRDLYRSLAGSLRQNAVTAKAAVVAHGKSASGPVDKVVRAKLRYDVLMIRVRAGRLEAAAQMLDAKIAGNAQGVKVAQARMKRLKRRGRNATAALGRMIAKTPRDVLSDSTSFMINMSAQTGLNMMPANIFRSWMAAADIGARFSRVALDSYANPFNLFLGGAKASPNSRLNSSRHRGRFRAGRPARGARARRR